MNDSFNTQSGAITHDSDARLLRWVQRDRSTGIETILSEAQAAAGDPIDATKAQLKYGLLTIGETELPALFTEPFEIRNRNRASFQVKFTPPTASEQHTLEITKGFEDFYFAANSVSSQFNLATIPAGATITGIVGTVVTPFNCDPLADSLEMKVRWVNSNPPHEYGTPIPLTDVTTGGTILDSGPMSFVYASNFAFYAQLDSDIDHLLNTLITGSITFVITYTTPTVFEWNDGDQCNLLAFASVDGLQYVPISVARHDFSNTPFVDIVKFERYNIPDDFNPDGGPLEVELGTLDGVSFKNAMQLFLTDFDNASTWNYIRFLFVWHPNTEGTGDNSDVTIEIEANAREI